MPELSKHQEETLRPPKDFERTLHAWFINKVEHLLSSGALGPDGYHHNTVHGVALENLAARLDAAGRGRPAA